MARAEGRPGIGYRARFRLDRSGHLVHADVGLAARSRVRSSLLLPRQTRESRIPSDSGSSGRPPAHLARQRRTRFTLRKGFRFSNGAPVPGQRIRQGVQPDLSPAMKLPGAQYVDSIAGAKDVLAGRATSARGIVAKGLRLVVKFTQPVPTSRQGRPCCSTAPSPTLPIDPEGVARFAAAGPYYVAQHVLGRRLVLERNRFYRGKRPQHVDRFVVDFAANPADVLDKIEQGAADWGWVPPPFYFDPDRKLARGRSGAGGRLSSSPGSASAHLRSIRRGRCFGTTPAQTGGQLRRGPRGTPAGAGRTPRLAITDQYLPPSLPASPTPTSILPGRTWRRHAGSRRATCEIGRPFCTSSTSPRRFRSPRSSSRIWRGSA